jgi:quinol monooxygenase YgiN
MFIAITIHHPASNYRDEFLAFTHKVVAAVEGSAGLIEFTVCRDPAAAQRPAEIVEAYEQ